MTEAPSPSIATSGASGLGIALAAIGLVLLWRAGRDELAVSLSVWAVAPLSSRS
jgi:hypothetical protein